MSGWRPQRKTLAVIEAARRVIEAAPFRPTLRRVFYELVSAGAIPNTERAYKNLSYQLDMARWEGLLEPDAFDDEGRQVEALPAWDGPRDFLDSVIPQYRTDWWAGSRPVEVWAEKLAVAGILRPVCARFGVPFLGLRGFSSFTALHEAAERFGWADHGPPVVVYVGDFDPSGLAMDNDLDGRMRRLGVPVDFRRVALTLEQIEERGLIPQPTKPENRANYWAHEGSWELDALPAQALADVVARELETLRPDDFDDRKAADRADRARLYDAARNLEDSDHSENGGWE